jgi:hypothetical protein
MLLGPIYEEEFLDCSYGSVRGLGREALVYSEGILCNSGNDRAVPTSKVGQPGR